MTLTTGFISIPMRVRLLSPSAIIGRKGRSICKMRMDPEMCGRITGREWMRLFVNGQGWKRNIKTWRINDNLSARELLRGSILNSPPLGRRGIEIVRISIATPINYHSTNLEILIQYYSRNEKQMDRSFGCHIIGNLHFCPDLDMVSGRLWNMVRQPDE